MYKGILPDIRSLLPVPNFPNMVNPTRIVRLLSLSRIAFQARCPEYALKSAPKRAIVLRWAKVSQSESSVWLVNRAAFVCTRSNAFICPSLRGSHGGEWSASRPGRFTHKEIPPVPIEYEAALGTEGGLDALKKRKISCPCREIERRSLGCPLDILITKRLIYRALNLTFNVWFKLCLRKTGLDFISWWFMCMSHCCVLEGDDHGVFWYEGRTESHEQQFFVK